MHAKSWKLLEEYGNNGTWQLAVVGSE